MQSFSHNADAPGESLVGVDKADGGHGIHHDQEADGGDGQELVMRAIGQGSSGETQAPVQGMDEIHNHAARRLSFESWLHESHITPAESSSQGLITPKKKSYVPAVSSSFIPVYVDGRKPVLGMSFDSLEDVEEFYKSYAHDGGFSVRIGPQNWALDEIINKRFMCSKAGYTKVKETDGPPKTQKNHAITRVGCNANIYVKLGADKKYYISKMVEEHNHPLCSPDKTPFLRSNRSVSQRVKHTLFTCQKASIGTSQAYRLLQVNDGGFQNIGCTKRDLQNYYRGLREKIKDADAQLFVAQLERKKEVNSAFFYDLIVDEDGKLLYIFWADATSRKNYSHFGDLVSFDSTYSTNQYNMKFTPFTGVNHHMQSVFFGGGFLINERIESYEWLFKTFVTAMGGKAPKLIITDEDASMKSAIGSCFPETVHRLCMWHILEKIPEKVGHAKTKEGIDFLVSSMMNMEISLGQIVSTTIQTRQQEYEGFIGCEIPNQIHIHPPNDVRSKGRSKRIKKSKELAQPRKRKNS